MRWAFHFDASACSGCKACQVACKDRNALPLGVLWRRVYEVSGGGWQERNHAWVSDVFAYNLSLACNHCDQPACVEACPTGAMHADADGVVLIDHDRCIGCRYCEWACPYGAPQYDAAARHMSKCTACIDDVRAGRQPACVAACGLRALDFGSTEDIQATYPAAERQLFPLPSAAHTSPSMLVTPHRAAARANAQNAVLANAEETSPRGSHAGDEHPLVLFTVVAQLAVGLFGMDFLFAPRSGGTYAGHVTAALLMGVAALASLLHLGHPLRAWRAASNLRTSWLSREIAATVAFTMGAALSALTGAPPLAAATTLCGAFLLYAMSAVYRLPAAAAWNSSRTPLEFVTTSAGLGVIAWLLLREAANGKGGELLVFGAIFGVALTIAVLVRAAFYARVLSVPAGPARALPAAGAGPAGS